MVFVLPFSSCFTLDLGHGVSISGLVQQRIGGHIAQQANVGLLKGSFNDVGSISD